MQQNIFNTHALLFGCGTMVLCLILQGLAVLIVMNPLKSRICMLNKDRHIILAQCVFFAGALVLLFSHLAQVYVWGILLNLSGILSDQHEAMLFAGSTYTTVGFVNNPLPREWQLAAIIMATNGFFSFAWSTSALFGLSRELYPGES